MRSMSTGSRIKQRRNLQKMTVRRLADAVGMSPGALSDLENDRHGGTQRLWKLADVLGVRVEWLQTGDGPIEPPAAEKPRLVYHARPLSEEAALLASDWDQLIEPARGQLRVMVSALLSAQLKGKRKGDNPPPPLRNVILPPKG